MPGSAFVLGGTGQVGRALVARLAWAGWAVTTAQRGERDAGRLGTEIKSVQVDRHRPGELESALGDGADVLVDVISYTRQDAEQLLGVATRVGALITISSVSVYEDDEALDRRGD